MFKTGTSIDLDQNATTPLDPDVLDAMAPHWLRGGNPESRHQLGRASRRGLEEARESSGAILNARPEEIVFVSGGTEGSNLAIFGLADESRGPGPIVATLLEHPAVSGPLEQLERSGFVIDRAPVGSDGIADVDAMIAALGPETRLAVLMLAQNETGALQPVSRLGSVARERGTPLHVDAAQAVGRIPVDFQQLGAATLVASAHKFHGPAGIGLLLVRKGVALALQRFGGGQQSGLRPGTPPVPLIVGMAAALRKWDRERGSRIARWERLRDRLEQGLRERLGPDRVIRNGPDADADRLPQTLNLGFPGLDGDALLIRLDLVGVACSLGSACASGASKPSPALSAMGVPTDRIRASVRFSLGAFTTEAEIEEAIARIASATQPPDDWD